MKKYAEYRGLIYRAMLDDPASERVELITTCADNGFSLDNGGNPNAKKVIYTKEVNRSEISALFDRKVFVGYHQLDFELYNQDLSSRDTSNGYTFIVTYSSEIAESMQFEKIDRFIYSKKIRLKDLDYLKITTTQDDQSTEHIVSKEDIKSWLKNNAERIP